MGEKRFADADRADNRDVGVALQKAKGRQLIEERAIEGDFRRGIPGFEVHRGIKMRFLHAKRHRETVPPGDFVAEDEQEPVLMRQLLLAREDEPLRQRVEEAPQAQAVVQPSVTRAAPERRTRRSSAYTRRIRVHGNGLSSSAAAYWPTTSPAVAAWRRKASTLRRAYTLRSTG